MIGETLGSYKIIDRIGAGGMGVVYLGEHPLLGKKAAVKLLLPEYSQNKEMVNRFFNEARATTLIKHPGLVDVFDFGHYKDGSAYIIMEYLEGESLSGLLERMRIQDLGLLVPLTRQIASAVGAAHKKGIVHRDLKPDNIFLIDDPDMPSGRRAKVLDFGIAKLMGGGGASSQTRSGSMMGTPLYMAPEQCRGSGTVDHRADIYALGCIMYEMLTGDPPFTGDGPGDVIASHLRSAPEPISKHAPHVDPEVEALVMKMLTKDPAGRPQTMAEVAGQLDRLWEARKAATSHPTRDRDLKTPLPQLLTGWVDGPAKPRRGVALAETQPEADDSSKTIAKAPPVGAAASSPRSEAVTTSDSGAVTGDPEPPKTRSKPPTMTTLGGATGETMPPQMRRRAWRLPAIAGAVVAAAVGGYLVWGRGTPKPGPKPVAAAPVVKPPVAPPAAPKPVPLPPPGPVMITMTIDSTPSGAEIFRVIDGMRVGKTPFSQTIARSDGVASFVLKLDGYEDGRVELAADHSGGATPELVKKAIAKGHPLKPTPHKPDAKPEGKPNKPVGTTPGPVEPPAKPTEKPKPKPDGNDPVDPFGRSPPG